MSTALPVPLNPLIGRQRELREVGGLLSEARLVTLTGAGGSGKTRLALEAARRNPEAADGPAWVELAPLSDPGLLAEHVAAALEARPGPGRNAVDALVATLKPRTVLLVFDNCEHLVDSCATLVETLLRSCPGLRILATSREPLGVPGERIWLVPPLSLPAGEWEAEGPASPKSEAIQLFATRAHEANPTFRLVEENAAAVASICRRLDGLPLALELAAARTRVLSVEQIASRLDDAFRLLTTGGRTSLPRQRTLRGAFDWSFDLLSREQQLLLQRLSVFAGGLSLEGVEAVCGGDGIEPAEVLDHLSALVDRSLVILEPEADEARYRILETVRQYGRERLRESGAENALRRRHAAYFTSLAESLAAALFGGAGAPALMKQLDQEHDNFRAAADWAVDPEGDGEMALRLVIALHWYWFARGLLLEGWNRVKHALRRGRSQAPPGLRGRALTVLGVVSFWLGTSPSTQAEVAESVALLRPEGDPVALAYALATFGSAAMFDQPAEAAEALAEAKSLVSPLPPTVLHSFVAYWQGRVAYVRGELALARAAFVQGASLGRRIGHLPATAHCLTVLGMLEAAEGNPTDAHRILLESLALHGQAGDTWGSVQTLKHLAQVSGILGDAALAVRLLAGAHRLGDQAGIVDTEAEAAEAERLTGAARAELGAQGFDTLWREGQSLSPEGLTALARKNPWSTRTMILPSAAELAAMNAGPSAPSVEPSGDARAAAAGPAQTGEEHPAEDAAEATEATARFEISALGPLRILSGGRPAPDEGWSAARTRELLVFLLLHPNGATKEEAGLALWPEATASQVRNSFHVTLHRLRSALGSAVAVRVQGGRYSLDPELIAAFDVPEFERAAKTALAAFQGARQGAPSEDGFDALGRALAAYRGELLQGEPAGEWHLEGRDRLQQLFLDLLAVGGPAFRRAGRLESAIEAYRRWVEADDLCEEAYRELMLCLAETGARQEALQLYRRLTLLLKRELDIEPEPATRAVHDRLRQG